MTDRGETVRQAVVVVIIVVLYATAVGWAIYETFFAG